MAENDREPHQPEPWKQEGRYVLDAGDWTLASTKFPADARRIVAAVNAVRGIPTDALESWVINVIGELESLEGALRDTPAESAYPNDRRVGDRRRGDRRASNPPIRIYAGGPPQPEASDGGKGQTGP